MTRRTLPLFALASALLVATIGIPAPAEAGDSYRSLGSDLDADEDGRIDLSAIFRVRAALLHNLDLDRGQTPSGELFFPQPVSDPSEQNLTHADMRLRTDLGLIAPTGGVGIKMRVDFFDNLALGSMPDGFPTATTSQEASEIIRIRQIYGEVRTPFGLILAGRMGNDWGTGMLANSGDCDDCDSGDAADRIAFTTPLFGHIWSVAYDFSAIGPTTPRSSGRTVDLDPSDDVRTVTFAFLNWQTDTVRQRRLEAERTTVEYGAYVSHRWQENDIPASYVPTAMSSGGFDADDVIRRDYTATAMDVWFRLTHPWIRTEVEFAVLLGTIGQASLTPGVSFDQEVTTTAWGGVIETDIGPTDFPLNGGVDFGIASGDSAPGFGVGKDLDLNVPRRGDLNGPQAAIPNDTTVDNFQFHPDYRVDRILFREIIGTVTDAIYVRPHIDWRVADVGPYALHFKLAAIASFAMEPNSAPGGAQPLGIEIDPTIEYGSSDGFKAALEHAVLIPLSGLDNPQLGASASPAQLLRLRLQYRY